MRVSIINARWLTSPLNNMAQHQRLDLLLNHVVKLIYQCSRCGIIAYLPTFRPDSGYEKQMSVTYGFSILWRDQSNLLQDSFSSDFHISIIEFPLIYCLVYSIKANHIFHFSTYLAFLVGNQTMFTDYICTSFMVFRKEFCVNRTQRSFCSTSMWSLSYFDGSSNSQGLFQRLPWSEHLLANFRKMDCLSDRIKIWSRSRHLYFVCNRYWLISLLTEKTEQGMLFQICHNRNSRRVFNASGFVAVINVKQSNLIPFHNKSERSNPYGIYTWPINVSVYSALRPLKRLIDLGGIKSKYTMWTARQVKLIIYDYLV